MGKISVSRVILGGLVAGVVINLFEFVLNGIILAADWRDAVEALGKPAVAGEGQAMFLFILWGFMAGFFVVWLYAAIRPRFGPGPKTAVIAGIALWVIGYVGINVVSWGFQLWPAKLTVIPLIEGLPEAVLGSLSGAWVYKEA